MDDNQRCHGCGASNPPQAQWCGQCHAEFTSATVPAAPVLRQGHPARSNVGMIGHAAASPPLGTRPSATGVTWQCQVCRATNDIGTTHCGGCGEGLSTSFDPASVLVTGGVGPARRFQRGAMERLSVGLRLVGIGFRTAWEDPRLLAAPLVAGLLTLGVLALVAVATGISPAMLLAMETPDRLAGTGLAIVVFAGAIFMVIAEAFVVAGAMQHFDMKRMQPAHAWEVAASRLPALAVWAFVQTVVGLVLSWFRQKAQDRGMLARGGAFAAETTWTTMTILVVPVILYEQANPFRAIKRSTQLFRNVWGQTLVGGFGLGLAMAALTVATIVVLVPFAFVHVGMTIAFAVVAVVILQLLGAVAGGALVAALYRYATTGQLPGDYGATELAASR